MTQTVPPSIYGRFIKTFSLKWFDFLKWRKPSDPSFVGASSYIFFKMNRFFKMTQAVPPSIYGRFSKTFSLKWIIFQHDANRPTLHLWALHHIFFFKINRFSKMTQAVQLSIHGRFIETFSLKWISFSTWRKPSDPSSVGAPSYIFFKMNQFFKMTQAVPPSIYGRFIKTFSLKLITFSTRRKPNSTFLQNWWFWSIILVRLRIFMYQNTR